MRIFDVLKRHSICNYLRKAAEITKVTVSIIIIRFSSLRMAYRCSVCEHSHRMHYESDSMVIKQVSESLKRLWDVPHRQEGDEGPIVAPEYHCPHHHP